LFYGVHHQKTSTIKDNTLSRSVKVKTNFIDLPVNHVKLRREVKMPSIEFQEIVKLIRENPTPDGLSIAERREAEDALAAQFPLLPTIYHEMITVTSTSSAQAVSVPALLIAAKGVDDARVILYLHGGGYCLGSILTHRDFAQQISAACGARVLLIDYRRAPEHPFPAALEDALTAYRWLLAEGIDPTRMSIIGDSAGGGLAAATLVALRDGGERLPGTTVLLSPWLDLALTGESLVTKADEDFMLMPAQLQEFASVYVGDDAARNPLISPLYADLSGLPPMLIQVGSTEILLDDAARFAAKAEAAGVEMKLDVWNDMIHVWQGFAGIMPEAKEAVMQIGTFVREYT
jgi:monoterpene epsilon-lactone hydrolase